MTAEWIRFGFCAFFAVTGLICFATAVLGVYKFSFIMDRIHSGGIGDTMGLACIAASVFLTGGIGMNDLKLILLLVFMWCTSPVSSHFLSQTEYFTNPHLFDHMKKGDPSWK